MFAIKDQTALTIAKKKLCGHGFHLICCQICFLTYFRIEICKLLSTNKMNITAYHLQTNGLTDTKEFTLKTFQTEQCSYSKLFVYM